MTNCKVVDFSNPVFDAPDREESRAIYPFFNQVFSQKRHLIRCECKSNRVITGSVKIVLRTPLIAEMTLWLFKLGSSGATSSPSSRLSSTVAVD